MKREKVCIFYLRSADSTSIKKVLFTSSMGMERKLELKQYQMELKVLDVEDILENTGEITLLSYWVYNLKLSRRLDCCSGYF